MTKRNYAGVLRGFITLLYMQTQRRELKETLSEAAEVEFET